MTINAAMTARTHERRRRPRRGGRQPRRVVPDSSRTHRQRKRRRQAGLSSRHAKLGSCVSSSRRFVCIAAPSTSITLMQKSTTYEPLTSEGRATRTDNMERLTQSKVT